MLFVRPDNCPAANRRPETLPQRSLKQYKTVHLRPGRSATVSFQLAAADLQLHGIEGATVHLLSHALFDRRVCTFDVAVGDAPHRAARY